MRLRLAVSISAGTIGLLTSASVAGQSQTFRATSNVIEVGAVVTDKTGAPARQLIRDDFVVLEDGAVQEITNFTFVDLGRATGAAPAVPAGSPLVPASTNALARTARVYVVALDAFNVDPAQSTNVRNLARRFIEESVESGDLAAVVTLGGPDSQPFTGDVPSLLRVVDGFIGQKGRSATLNIARDLLMKPTDDPGEDPETGAKANAARIMLAGLQRICESLGGVEGVRRSIVLFSEGIELDTSDLLGADPRPSAGGQALRRPASRYASIVLDAQRDMLVAARRANGTIHTIDPRGSSIGQESIMQAELPKDPRTGRPIVPTLDLAAEVRRGQGTLRVFAEETGGQAIVNTNGIDEGFRRIVLANTAYYLIGYKPSRQAGDGRYHRIEVQVKPRDLRVVARKGYFEPVANSAAAPADAVAAAEGPSPRIRQLLASQLPVPGLRLRATGGPVGMQGDKVIVALVLDIETRDLAFTEQGNQIANDLEMGFVAIDETGQAQAGTSNVGRLRLPADQRSSVSQGLRYAMEVPVPPGRYQFRLAAHESAGGTGGSVILDVEAMQPDRATSRSATVLLTSPGAGNVPTTGRLDIIRRALSTPPTATFEFASGETVTALVYLSTPAQTAAERQLIPILTNAVGEIVRRGMPANPASVPGNAGRLVLARLPLGDVAPGSYVLRFQVTDREAAQIRAIPIVVK